MKFCYNTNFTLPNYRKDLDPSYQMDLDFFGDCFERKVSVLQLKKYGNWNLHLTHSVFHKFGYKTDPSYSKLMLTELIR